MSQGADRLDTYMVRSLCAHIVDSLITARWHEGKKEEGAKPNKEN